MRYPALILGLGLTVALSTLSHATPVKKTAHARPTKQKKAKKGAAAAGDLKTDVSFDDSVLHGQYQTPDEALARVENEKGYGDLVGVRKHFKDRLQRASEQE